MKITDVKTMLYDKHQFEIPLQKLILRGKTANDDQTMETLGVKDGDFIVLMISKVTK